jgi:hypothetical protein
MNSELHTLCFRHSRNTMMRQLTVIAATVMSGPHPRRGIFASTSVTPASSLDTVVARLALTVPAEQATPTQSRPNRYVAVRTRADPSTATGDGVGPLESSGPPRRGAR